MNNIHIKGGRVIDPANRIDAIHDVYIMNGRITAIGNPPPAFANAQIIDASDQVVCPGLIDLCARLREPGQEYKATIASEARAAASSGITTLCCPPDTDPVIDHPAIAEFIQQRALRLGKSQVVTLGALTQGLQGEMLSEMGALKAAGCVGMTNAYQAIKDTRILRRSFEYAASLDITVFLTPQDFWLAQDGCMHEGMVSTRHGLPGIPEIAESIATARDLLLIEKTGVRAHFSHLSSQRAIEMVAKAIARGLPVTADVTAHHLHLTELDVSDFNTQCHVQPPLRSSQDRESILQGIKQGAIQAVCSDHQPHDADAKLLPFSLSAPGISGLETLLALTLRLTETPGLTFSETLALLTSNPANILKLDTGKISVGSQADICIFDPAHEWTVDPENFLSKGHNTPFAGWQLRGKVTHTLQNGRIIYPE